MVVKAAEEDFVRDETGKNLEVLVDRVAEEVAIAEEEEKNRVIADVVGEMVAKDIN